MAGRDTSHSARRSNGPHIRLVSSFGYERSFFPLKLVILLK
jgi:hypothetical protein